MNIILQCGLAGSRKVLVLVPKTSVHRGSLLTSRCPSSLSQKTVPIRMMSMTRTRTSLSPMGIFLFTIPIGTFCLGTWQFQRRKWKLNLIAQLKEKTNAPPIDFPQDLSELNDLEYQKVKLTGTFDHRREIYMGPRSLLVDGNEPEGGGGLLSTGQSGYLVITPFKLADRDLTILVNRGWVARNHKNPKSRLEGQVEGTVNLTAVVRKTEERAPFMPDSTKGSLLFTFRDVTTMAEMTGTEPVCLDAVETLPGGPLGGQTRVTLRNEHLSYMFTWYSLSIATTYLWYQRFVRGKALM